MTEAVARSGGGCGAHDDANSTVVAVYGWGVEHEHFDALIHFFEAVCAAGWRVQIYRPLLAWLHSQFGYTPEYLAVFGEGEALLPEVRFMVSIGGDGTFLDSAQYIAAQGVPIIGVNFGHLGFLTSAQTNDAQQLVQALVEGRYTVERRTMLEVRVAGDDGGPYVCLNDITLHKSEKSMLVVNAHIDGQFLCSYWCDGLIASTPTGSTAYSLSVGGPIIVPCASTILLSPIAPHNLSMRPLVLSDASRIHLRAVSRDPSIVLGVDARVFHCNSPLEVTIARSACQVQVVRLHHEDFYTALRKKLNWGVGVRN